MIFGIRNPGFDQIVAEVTRHYDGQPVDLHLIAASVRWDAEYVDAQLRLAERIGLVRHVVGQGWVPVKT